jgi:hypothetical protein
MNHSIAVNGAPRAALPAIATQARRRRWLIAGVALVGAALAVGYTRLAPSEAAAQRAAQATKAAAAERKQKAAALYDYPASSGSLPGSITIAYDGAKDRTRMTLALDGLNASAPSNYRLGRVGLTLVSEFPGRTRDPERGELSARCTLSVVADSPGALAPSSPPAQITADTRALHAYAPSATDPGYHSKHRADGAHESLVFLVHTRDLITSAKARRVALKAGAVTVSLSPEQLASVREFVARMNPKP